MRRALAPQLLLPIPTTWGGAHPVHVTLRAQAGLPTFRAPRLFHPIREALHRVSGEAFRVVQFSVQSNHVHLLVEAEGRERLIRGMQGLAVRVARAVNRILSRRGRVFADRYHRRDLTTPREVRHALVYVLMNHKKHRVHAQAVDLCSSGPWFTGWKDRLPATSPRRVEVPVADARTWLLRVGCTRYGLIAVDEAPRTG